MFRKIEKWYSSLSNPQQLLLIFLGSWLMWFGIQPLKRWFAGEDYPGVESHDFVYSFIMAIIWTLFSAYNKVKRLFTKKQPDVDGK